MLNFALDSSKLHNNETSFAGINRILNSGFLLFVTLDIAGDAIIF